MSGYEDKKVLYFAYGSCMGADFDRTVPEYKRTGRAVLNGYRLGFTRYAWTRHGGVADIVPEEGKQLEGVLYEFDEHYLKCVDAREGVGSGAYRRIPVTVVTETDRINAWTYEVVDKASTEYSPSDEYAFLLIEAAEQYLSETYTGELQNHIEVLQDSTRPLKTSRGA